MRVSGHDTLEVRRPLQVGDLAYDYFCLPEAEKRAGRPVPPALLAQGPAREPAALRGRPHRHASSSSRRWRAWLEGRTGHQEIAYRPARVLMQDFTGVPAVVDLAAMRDAMIDARRRPEEDQPAGAGRPRDRPLGPGRRLRQPGRLRAQRRARVRAQRRALRLPALGRRRRSTTSGSSRPAPASATRSTSSTSPRSSGPRRRATASSPIPDTLVGTDSHTTMVNGLGVLGWGVGGIEAEAAMLGQPVSMLIPEVVGFRLTGKLPEGATATDLVLTVTQMLRKKGVVGKFVEFFGPGLANLPLADRATIANMAPEYGATCGFFPVDDETLDYLRLTGRDPSAIALVEAYAKAQGLWRRRARRSRCSPTRSSSTCARSSPRSPARGAPRTGCRSKAAKAELRSDDVRGQASPATATRRRRARRSRVADYSLHHGRRRDRRHHQLHQHLQSQRHDRRRPARQEGGRARPDSPSPGSRPRSPRARASSPST